MEDPQLHRPRHDRLRRGTAAAAASSAPQSIRPIVVSLRIARQRTPDVCAAVELSLGVAACGRPRRPEPRGDGERTTLSRSSGGCTTVKSQPRPASTLAIQSSDSTRMRSTVCVPRRHRRARRASSGIRAAVAASGRSSTTSTSQRQGTLASECATCATASNAAGRLPPGVPASSTPRPSGRRGTCAAPRGRDRARRGTTAPSGRRARTGSARGRCARPRTTCTRYAVGAGAGSRRTRAGAPPPRPARPWSPRS